MKIEQNYSKYIFNKSIGQNLQPIGDNESNIKCYWISFIMSLLFFIQTILQPTVESPFCYYFFDTFYHSITFYSMLFVIVSPALTQFSETLQQRNFLQLKFYVSPTKLMSFLQICTSNYSLLVK